MKKSLLLTLAAITASTFFFNATAQNVGIGTTTPNASAILDIKSVNKGLLVPQVSLVSLTDVVTVPTPATGLLVYNINAALPGGTGFYYNNGITTAASWLKLQTGAGGGGSGWALTGNTGTDTAINFLGTIDDKPLRLRINNTWAGQLGKRNVLLGANAGRAIEESLLPNIPDGNYNVGVGSAALRSIISGYNNVAVGSGAMANNVSDNSSVAIGDSALYFNDDPLSAGNLNTGIGTHAMVGTASNGDGEGYYNTAVGGYSLVGNVIGNYNVAIGVSASSDNIVGQGNTAVGTFSMVNNVYGSGNTAVGFAADIDDTAFFNATAIGYGAFVTDSNRVQIGNTDVTSIGGQVSWTTFSDGRYKTNVQQDVKGLDFVMQLRPVTYNLDMQKLNNEKLARYARLDKFYALKKGGNSINGRGAAGRMLARYSPAVVPLGRRQSGFIAQEVAAAAEKVGYEFSGVDKPKNTKGKYGIRYAEFVVPLIKAVQEQQSIIDAQNKKIDALVLRLEKLEAR